MSADGSALITIANIVIRQDAEGRYSLNDLHRAAGGEQRHRPNYWLSGQQTKELLAELEGGAGNPAGPVVTVNDGRNNGTYVVKELVYAYAMWISAAFHLKVIRAYDAMATGGAPAAQSKDSIRSYWLSWRWAGFPASPATAELVGC